jgi:ankyrin repeat protein
MRCSRALEYPRDGYSNVAQIPMPTDAPVTRSLSGLYHINLRRGRRSTEGHKRIKIAASCGRLDTISQCLDHGADIDEIPDYDDVVNYVHDAGLGNALHEAAKKGQKEAVKLLLEKGAIPVLKVCFGRTGCISSGRRITKIL